MVMGNADAAPAASAVGCEYNSICSRRCSSGWCGRKLCRRACRPASRGIARLGRISLFFRHASLAGVAGGPKVPGGALPPRARCELGILAAISQHARKSPSGEHGLPAAPATLRAQPRCHSAWSVDTVGAGGGAGAGEGPRAQMALVRRDSPPSLTTEPLACLTPVRHWHLGVAKPQGNDGSAWPQRETGEFGLQVPRCQ